MRQSRFVYFGLLEIAVAVVFVALFGPAGLFASPLVALLVVSGVLAVLGGTVASIDLGGVAVTWRHLLGASYAVAAATLPVLYAPDVLAGTATDLDYLMFACGLITAVCLGFFAVEVARDGRHYEITGDVDRVLAL